MAIIEDVELQMKDQYPWAFEIEQARMDKLKAQDELEKGAPAAPAPPVKE